GRGRRPDRSEQEGRPAEDDPGRSRGHEPRDRPLRAARRRRHRRVQAGPEADSGLRTQPRGGRVSGYVLLEDGTRFDGELLGSGGEVTGEVVFNTAMTGYQEAVTDPSYAGQIITFTYPLIGNYGVSGDAMESERVQARGVIMREGKNGEDVATAEGG